jgi:putative tricarboxylic transport membrane protein
MFPAILLFSCIGIYSVKNDPGDVLMSAGLAVVGWFLLKLEFETAPMLLGFVLGRLMEENLRRALAISRGSLASFVQRPLSGLLLLVAVVVLAVAVLPSVRRRRQEVFTE